MEMVLGLYGSKLEKNKACAYCKHHHCYLTVKQLRRHKCLQKECWYLNKNEEHNWWKYRKAIKSKKIK